MPARDILWAPGLTLPQERMYGLSCSLKDGRKIPRLVGPNASTDQIADAVQQWMKQQAPSPDWGYQLGNISDLNRIESILSRSDVHWIRYNPQSVYADPRTPTMVLAFICQIGPLPEDIEFDTAPGMGDGWDWPDGSRHARYIYRWRVDVSWKDNFLYVKVEKLMQFQKLTAQKEWRIFNKGGQNQLYAYQPHSGTWWSGVDVGDWIQTHAIEIGQAIEAVVWAAISVVSLGVGAAAAAGVATMKAVAQIAKSAAIAAATGQPFDFGQFFVQLGAAAAAFIQVPGVSELLNEIGTWAKEAGETVLRELMSNGIFSSFLSSGGGFITDLVEHGVKLYGEVKGWINTAPELLNAVNKLGAIAQDPGQLNILFANVAPAQIQSALDLALKKLSNEIHNPKTLASAALDTYKRATAELDLKLKQIVDEVKQTRRALPDHLQPWFDYGKSKALTIAQAPFYAQGAVQLGVVSADLANDVIAAIQAEKSRIDTQASLLEMIPALEKRYDLLELTTALAPRYANQP